MCVDSHNSTFVLIKKGGFVTKLGGVPDNKAGGDRYVIAEALQIMGTIVQIHNGPPFR
jgi:hypothetical protein